MRGHLNLTGIKILHFFQVMQNKLPLQRLTHSFSIRHIQRFQLTKGHGHNLDKLSGPLLCHQSNSCGQDEHMNPYRHKLEDTDSTHKCLIGCSLEKGSGGTVPKVPSIHFPILYYYLIVSMLVLVNIPRSGKIGN